MEKEKELTQETESDIMTCVSCEEETTREQVIKIYKRVPFEESNNKYYCGCIGWE